MVTPDMADEFLETILSGTVERKPGTETAKRDNATMTTLLNLLGKKHTISIMHQFATEEGPFRFSDLEEAVDIAPNTLSNRLQELTDVGLLTRESYNEIPPRVEYDATEKAQELSPIFWYLGVWTERHILETTDEADEKITQ